MKESDPLTRKVEKGDHQEELSPMAPPDAYEPPGDDQSIAYEQMHPFLQGLRDEHQAAIAQLNTFEEALTVLQEQGVTREVDSCVSTFFRFLDENVFPHNRREEKQLFPLLAKRLLEHGEHSKGEVPTTAVDMLEDDHVRLMQLASVIFNFFGLASRLPDERSCLMVLDAAVQQAKSLVEQLRLHIFREDTVVFSLAHKYIDNAEFDQLASGSIQEF